MDKNTKKIVTNANLSLDTIEKILTYLKRKEKNVQIELKKYYIMVLV